MNRTKRTATRNTPATTTPVTAIDAAPDTAIDVTADVVTVPADVRPRALTFADFGVTVPNPPAALAAFVAGFRAVSSMPVATDDDRRAVAAAFRAACDAVMPGTPDPTGRHTGRFTGQPVFESQNTLYVAAALANVPVTSAHVTAAWRVELPNAKCDYIARHTYGRTTLSEYLAGRHNAVPNIPGARAIVDARRSTGNGPLFRHGTDPATVAKIDG